MGPFTKVQAKHTNELWSTASQLSQSQESLYHGDVEELSGDEEYPSITEQVGLKRHIVRMFSEDASGTSAVAIDNKIEQAMDLVKSHLMIAVREEVEVLKEKISELMDKINQLEVENTILKANMSQETLHQLQMQTQLQIAGSVGSGNMIAAPPLQQQIQQQPPQQQQQMQQQQQQQQQQTIPQQSQQQQQQAPPQAVVNPATNSTTGPLS